MQKIGFFLMFLILSACAHSLPKKVLISKSSLENQEIKTFKKINKLENELRDLKTQNDILKQALSEYKIRTSKSSPNSGVSNFPKFDELVYDQAKKAYDNKDAARLLEALKILQSNHPESPKLDSIYFWLAQVQFQNNEFNNALYTANNFLKIKPRSNLIPNILYMKGQIYENMNLKIQAINTYKNLKNSHPEHVMAGLAIDKIKDLSPEDLK